VLPQTRSWIKGPTSKGRRGEETETGREGQERERREGAWKGRVRGRARGPPTTFQWRIGINF